MPRSDLSDFNDAYIVVKGRVTGSLNPRRVNYVKNDFADALFLDKSFPEGSTDQQKTTARNAAKANAVNTANFAGDKRNLIKGVSFRNNAPFINCISKINGTLIDNAEHLDFEILMYNLLEYSTDYTKTTGSLWNYYRDEPTSDGEINHYLGPKSFDLKSRIMGNLLDINDGNQASKDKIRFAVPLKQLSNFWRSLKMPLINCEMELILNWSKICVILSNARRDAIAATEINAVNVSVASATFELIDTKFYVPVATLSEENCKKILEQLKSGFKKPVKSNKYRSEMTTQSNNNNLNYLIDPAFTKVSRLFVLSFERIEEKNVQKDHSDSVPHCYVPNVEIKGFNVLIDGKSFFDLPVKNEEEAYEKIIEMSKNNDYTSGNLLDFAYLRKKITD